MWAQDLGGAKKTKKTFKDFRRPTKRGVCNADKKQVFCQGKVGQMSGAHYVERDKVGLFMLYNFGGHEQS